MTAKYYYYFFFFDTDVSHSGDSMLRPDIFGAENFSVKKMN